MVAPVKPETSQGTPGTPVPSAAELASRGTQPTNHPSAPATEAPVSGASVQPAQQEPTAEQRLIASQEALLREQARNLASMQQRLRGIEERQIKAEEPAGPTLEQQNADYWKNPVGIISELISKELKRTVDPINQRLQQGESVSEYDRVKARLKLEYADIWDKIEPSIDNWASSATQNGQQLNDELVSIAALTASGAYYRGQLPGHARPGNPSPPAAPPAPPAPPSTGTEVLMPPHLRPSAPLIPGQDQPQKKEVRALTENEARLARERKMTNEQFLAWIDVPPEQVVHSTLGRPAK